MKIAPFLDCEASGFDTATVRGRYQTRLYIRQAINRCIRVTGHRPIIYTGKWFWEETINCRWSMSCALWLVSYPQPVQCDHLPVSGLPSAWKQADLWQFTDGFESPGIKTPCDYSVYAGKDKSNRACQDGLDKHYRYFHHSRQGNRADGEDGTSSNKNDGGD